MRYRSAGRIRSGMVLVLLLLAISGSAGGGPARAETTGSLRPSPSFLSMAEVRQLWAEAEAQLLPPRVEVRGIYLTAHSASRPELFEPLLRLVEQTELNAMVVDIKTDYGTLAHQSANQTAREAGAVRPFFADLPAFTQRLKESGVYSIARLVVFKDGVVPRHRPEMAIADARGGIWQDYGQMTWLNPYSPAAWEYVVDVAKEAALAGFDEIQFDYVRFPTDGNLDRVRYPGKDGRSREQVIAGFLAYARKELRPYGVWTSADVFGLATSVPDDMGIGHHLETVSAAVDYLSPMVYPSHYIPGNLGLADPDSMPYETVYRSLLDVKRRWAEAGLADRVTMRPWLQDFTWGHSYGVAEVRAQIDATYAAGYSEWLLWNSANRYTVGALKAAE